MELSPMPSSPQPQGINGSAAPIPTPPSLVHGQVISRGGADDPDHQDIGEDHQAAEIQEAPPLHPLSGGDDTVSPDEERPTESANLRKEWMNKTRGWLMVLAILVASVSYQAGLNPPGGFWQDNSPPKSSNATAPISLADKGHTAGYPVLRDMDSDRYYIFYAFNAAAFAGSVVIVILLTTEAFFHRETNLNLLRGLVYGAMINLTVAFGAGSNRSKVGSIVFFCLVGFMFLQILVDVWCIRRCTKRASARGLREDVESGGGRRPPSENSTGV